MSNDNVLKKEFNTRDVQRMRNIITKDYSAKTSTQIGYTKENIIDAMLTVSKDSFHVETNFKHIGLDFFARPDKLSKYSFKSEKKAVTNNYNGTL